LAETGTQPILLAFHPASRQGDNTTHTSLESVADPPSSDSKRTLRWQLPNSGAPLKHLINSLILIQSAWRNLTARCGAGAAGGAERAPHTTSRPPKDPLPVLSGSTEI